MQLPLPRVHRIHQKFAASSGSSGEYQGKQLSQDEICGNVREDCERTATSVDANFGNFLYRMKSSQRTQNCKRQERCCWTKAMSWWNVEKHSKTLAKLWKLYLCVFRVRKLVCWRVADVWVLNLISWACEVSHFWNMILCWLMLRSKTFCCSARNLRKVERSDEEQEVKMRWGHHLLQDEVLFWPEVNLMNCFLQVLSSSENTWTTRAHISASCQQVSVLTGKYRES